LHKRYGNQERDDRSHPTTSWTDFEVTREHFRVKPTSIVVLKAEVGNRNGNGNASSNLLQEAASKGHHQNLKENRTNVLQDLRERLQLDRKERPRAFAMGESYRKSFDDPKEIARQIVIQARENALRHSLNRKAMSKSISRMAVPPPPLAKERFGGMSRDAGSKKGSEMEVGSNNAGKNNCRFAHHHGKGLNDKETHGAELLVSDGSKIHNLGESGAMDPEALPNLGLGDRCSKAPGSGSGEEFHNKGSDPELLESGSCIHGTTNGESDAFFSSMSSSHHNAGDGDDEDASATREDGDVQFAAISGGSPEVSVFRR
jgi:hypothetical protein